VACIHQGTGNCDHGPRLKAADAQAALDRGYPKRLLPVCEDCGEVWTRDFTGMAGHLCTRPREVRVVIPWPRYPTMTPGGKESGSKKAGHLVPWLSANVVNNLAHPVYRDAVGRWRDAAQAAAEKWIEAHAMWRHLGGRHVVLARLFRATSHVMDTFAVLEGCKPAIDGIVRSAILIDDNPEHIAGGLAWSYKAATRADCRLELRLRPLQV
jgi:hypothetical protein